jgi:levansucrase
MPALLNSGQSDDVCATKAASLWTAEHIALIGTDAWPASGLIRADDAKPLLPEILLWDIWPIQLDNGEVAKISRGSLWVILSAPHSDDPNDRHGVARMRLLLRTSANWVDCGNLLPDGFSPGSREWSGATRFDPTTDQVTLWFTAAGRRGEQVADFEQRLFHAVGRLDVSGEYPCVRDWADLTETAVNDGAHYADLRHEQGVEGRIKGYRDPYWFRDPADGKGYVLFTGSKAAAVSRSDYDGVIGIARAGDADGLVEFKLLPPIVDADGLANELERPHMFVRDGLYYLFWSTQRGVFNPLGVAGPTGLYGMVGASVFGPFEPLNGSGLVVANPKAEPRQAYAWQVLPSLDVISFVDHWGLEGRDITVDLGAKSAQFGGTIAPFFKIGIDGAKTWVIDGEL